MEKWSEVQLKFEMRRLEYLEKKMDMHEKSIKRKSASRLVLGLFLGGIVTFSLLFLLTRAIPDANRDVVIALVSGLTGAFFGSVINYYFGDSESHIEMPPSMEEPIASRAPTQEAPLTDFEP